MKLLRLEFKKLIHQRRSYVGWVGIAAVPVIMAAALSLSSHKPNAAEGGPDVFLALASGNGMYVAIAAIAILTMFLLPLLASMAGSWPIAGEAESATLKTWLFRPVTRGGVLLSKWVVAIVYLAIALGLVAAAAYTAGAIAFGLHAPALLSGGTVTVAHGLWLTLLAYLFVLAGAICVLSLATLLSTLTNSSLTATIGALVIVIVLNVLGSFSFFDFLKPYVFTSRLEAWQGLFSSPIDWTPITHGLVAFTLTSAVLTIGAWIVFRRRDVLA
jgi:ABC-2 type transport system permease protein